MSFDGPTLIATPREVAARDREVIARADLVPVLLLDDGPLGNAGEVRGYPRETAQSYVSRGVASFDLHASPRKDAAPVAMEKANGALTAAAAGDVGLEFVEPWEGYAAGQCAGFSEGLARRLVGAGVARPYNPAAAPRRTLADMRAALAGC